MSSTGSGWSLLLANAVAGVLVGLDLDRRPALVRQGDVLCDDEALPLPSHCQYIVAVLSQDASGTSAVVYAARMHPNEAPPLKLLDFDVGPMRSTIFQDIGTRIRELSKQCRPRASVVFVQGDLMRHAIADGLKCEEIPKEMTPGKLLFSAAYHVGANRVKLCEPALERTRTSTLGGALDFRAGESSEDALRCAIIMVIALTLDLRDRAGNPMAWAGPQHNTDGWHGGRVTYQ